MSNVVKFPQPVEAISFEYALDLTSKWLEDTQRIMQARSAQASRGKVVLPADEAEEIAEGLRIVVSHLKAMRQSLD